MKSDVSTVILPTETQSREFDAKLLFACCLAQRGQSVIVGSRVDIHNRIHKFPAGIYIAKDFRKPSNRIFRILKGLGHRIVAWDEEGLIFFDTKLYHERRVHAETLGMVDEFFAWGNQNRDLTVGAPGYRGQPINVFGNPRVDMLRPELRAMYGSEINELHQKFGRFILVNTNFGKLNHFLPKYTVKSGGRDASVGGGITAEMNEAWQHRAMLFNAFKSLVSRLADGFPDRTIVIRPHPAEDHDAWILAGSGSTNVVVVHQGSVNPWLLACDVMVHSSCTTGIEGYLLGANVISFRPVLSDRFDHKTSNDLSHQAFSADELVATVKQVLAGEQLKADNNLKNSIAAKLFASLSGPLASDRIAERVVSISNSKTNSPLVPWLWREHARFHAALRWGFKWIASFVPDHKNSMAYNRKRFPGVTIADVNQRISQFRETLGRFDDVAAEVVSENIFRIYRT